MRLLMFIAAILCLNTVEAQRLYSEVGDIYEKSKRAVVDNAKLGAFYELKFRKDSTKLNDYTKAQTVLMISDNYLLFGDYNRLAFDSINDCLAASKRNARNDQARDEWMEAIEKWTYFFVTLTDLTKQQTTVQAYDILRSYEYTYPTPHMEWQLIPGDTLIQNRPCKKATCTFSGRIYVAWYTESIPLPYGPYLFGGLPGLIMEIHDTKRNWIFTNNGFGKMPKYSSMYLYKKQYIQDLIVTTREKALTGYRNDIEDFDNLGLEIFKVKEERNGKMVTPEANNPKRPSNMLELQW
ncbi:GLPGLI family protein [Bacteroides uniformis]|uniref:GLPGLI family protein n=2 Tax=Bacteroides uniformis TaxID=820 RepID=UPI002FEE5806